ncbi:hypothetical protein C667_04069 [Thauera phenylacetica B4P]|uniref:Uncharacterized protein n=1 Tax=Thauera phenylacetica B4P TaxID=1234382 RepID=N6Z3B9_9RHOO|nr:hypothetical protein [Thauera phenylacetica]ENO98375.1 hypothetical protein C667_04069 [Thauera phenylacetica B4P]
MHVRTYAAQVERALGIAAEELTATGRPEAAFAHAIVRAIPAAQHFTLPAGGRLFDDGLRGLDTDLHAIRLPFPIVTISFADGARRTLVIAQEQHEAGQNTIVVRVAVDTGDGQGWGFYPCTAQPEQRHDDGSIGWQCFDSIGSRLDRTPMHEAVMAAGRSVLELAEALSCNNVASEVVERVDPAVNARRRRQGKLPLYETRALVVKVGDVAHAIGSPMGDRNGPREHLRRGHVRRLPDGRKTWVQACVVGSRALGVVRKSAYAVEVAR